MVALGVVGSSRSNWEGRQLAAAHAVWPARRGYFILARAYTRGRELPDRGAPALSPRAPRGGKAVERPDGRACCACAHPATGQSGVALAMTSTAPSTRAYCSPPGRFLFFPFPSVLRCTTGVRVCAFVARRLRRDSVDRSRSVVLSGFYSSAPFSSCFISDRACLGSEDPLKPWSVFRVSCTQ